LAGILPHTILLNKPLTKQGYGPYYEISYALPFWFTNWDEQKVIKVNGCSFAYLESEDQVPKPSAKYSNQFISVHSNITRDDTEHLPIFYLPSDIPTQNESETNANYMMVVNNYYTPKVHDLTNSTAKAITIWFKDSYGDKIPLRTSYSSEGPLEEIYQAVFKIECELAIARGEK
jgi:hypothetical protein